MALIKCPACAKEISADAKACPHCGKPLADGCLGGGLKVVFAIFLIGSALMVGCVVLFFGLAAVGRSAREDVEKAAGPVAAATPTPLSADEIRLGPQPDYCPGSGLPTGLFGKPKAPPCAVERLLAKTLNDPKSFEMDQRCDVSPGKTAWIVTCDYRARNAFGGLVRQVTQFEVRGNNFARVVPQ
jgi:hypothetical protein